MIYKFIDDKGTFRVKNPQDYSLYFPLANSDGSLLSSISPNLSGDIKADNDRFITPPLSSIDIKTNLLCRRDFFIRVNNKILRLSFPWKDHLEAGLLYHKIIKENSLFKVEILNFIPHNLDCEVMQVKIKNKTKRSLKITPTSFVPLYGRSADNLRDHRHVSSFLNRIKLNEYFISLKPTMVFNEAGHKLNQTEYFCIGFEEKATAPIGQFPTLDYFSGRGDLLKPQAILENNIKPLTKEKSFLQGKEALASFRFKKKTLNKNQEVNYYMISGIGSPSQIFKKLNSPSKINKVFAETKNYWLKTVGRISFDFQDKDFNNWLLWVKLQPTLRRLFGNSFLPHFDYGKGGRGWRDLSQDALSLLLTEPKKAKQLIVNNFKGVRIDGSNATIITKEGHFLSDRNSIPRVWMDHAIWPYLALRLYIDQTANLKLLNKETAYFRDHLLNRATEIDENFKQKDFSLRTRSGKIYKGSIIEHILVQHLVSFFNVGKHNIIRLENADWNDGLDMAKDCGESVAFSFMYARNLKDLSGLLKQLNQKQKKLTILKEVAFLLDRIKNPVNYNDFKAKQKRLKAFFEKSRNITGQKNSLNIEDIVRDLEEKSQHLFNWLNKKEWLNVGFFNGYYDNKGKAVEEKRGKKIKMMLASQVFAILSGGIDKQRIKAIDNSINKYLKDKSLGGYRLNTNFESLCLDLGRAFGFSYGDKENGAFFNHMVVMLGFALYSQGFKKEGLKALSSIYKMTTSKAAKIYPQIPEYFNNQGLGLYFYLTGSASWYIYTLFEKVLGIKFEIGDIHLNPGLTGEKNKKNKIELRFLLGKKKINLTYQLKKRKDILTIKRLTLEGKEIKPKDSNYIIKRNLLKDNCNIKVYLG